MRLSALAAAAAGMVIGSAAQAEIVIVNVFDFDFSVNLPGEPIVDAVINVGDTVRWVFLEPGHSATSVMGIPEVFDSGVDLSGTYDHTFTNVGTWWYYCTPHGFDLGDGTAVGMVGTVTVLPSPASAAVLVLLALAPTRRRK